MEARAQDQGIYLPSNWRAIYDLGEVKRKMDTIVEYQKNQPPLNKKVN